MARLGLSWVGHSSVGVKTRNAPLNSDQFDLIAAQKRAFSCNTSDLYLSVDFLRDHYTLLRTPLTDSPHRHLMEALKQGDKEKVLSSEYVQRSRAGTLDPRGRKKVFAGELDRAFQQCMASISEGSYVPIRVVNCDNQWHIADGKHRAALSAIETGTINCIDITRVYLDSYYRMMFRKMKQRPHLFESHISFFESIYRSASSADNVPG